MQADGEAHSETPTRDKNRRLIHYALALILVALLACIVFDLLHQEYSSRYAFGFTAVGVWAFGITALIVGAQCIPSTRHRVKILTILLLGYAGSYVCLTLAGDYYFSQTGSARYSSGLSMSNVAIWVPRFLHWEFFQNIQGQPTSRGTALGYYYSPLIMVDRQWIHPTQQLFAEVPTEEELAK